MVFGLEKLKLETKGFQNVKNQIGFCGIWCGSCVAGSGAILELTKRYEQVVKNYNLEKWAPKGFDFKEFAKGLACIQAMSLCPGCEKNGGPPTCKIRSCASKKGLADCSQCELLLECGNFEELEKSHPKIRQDLVKIKSKDRGVLVEKWIHELETKWPHCVLACNAMNK
jgi:hypothetical protein